MTKIFLTGLAMGTAALIGFSDVHVAKAEPLVLSVSQLDDVTAGKKRFRKPGKHTAVAGAGALALGHNTKTATVAIAVTSNHGSLSLSGAAACTGCSGHHNPS